MTPIRSTKRLAAAVLALSFAAFADPALAIDDSFAGPTERGRMDYLSGAGLKLGRGVANTAFGWLDFFKGIQDVADRNNEIAAITWGPIHGAGQALVRTGAGVYEIATFPIPAPRGFDEPLVEPEFVLDSR